MPARALSWRAVALGAALLAGAGSSHALFSDDEARKAILDLRARLETLRQNQEAASAQQAQTIQALQSELARATEDNAQLRRSLLALQSQIDALKAEQARAIGQDEQLARSVAEVQRQQRDLLAALDARLRPLEPVSVTVDGEAFQAEPAEKRDYDAAFALFRQGDFAQAREAFESFAQRYPRSGYAPSVAFWLGNSLYALRDHKGTITQLTRMATQWPRHPKAPEALLAVANSQVELKDTRGARKTLGDVGRLYPQSEAAGVARDRLGKLK